MGTTATIGAPIDCCCASLAAGMVSPMRSHTTRQPGPLAVASTLRASVLGLGLCLGLWACNASSTDPLYDCKAPPPDVAACVTTDDCTTVTIGCYCGAQPVNGVARRFAASGQACQDTAASTCALGCATELGMQAQDGQKVTNASMIAVRCEQQGSAAGTCQTYVP